MHVCNEVFTVFLIPRIQCQCLAYPKIAILFLFVQANYLDISLKGSWFPLTRFFSVDSDLEKLAQEVLELIKSLVGRETFSRAYASLQQTTTEARETRKRKKALEVSLHLSVCH